MGSLARPYMPCPWILLHPQNYHSQSIGSALWASPFASFVAFPRKHDPNVSSALRASPFERRKCSSPHFFVRLMSASRSRLCCARLRPRWVCHVSFNFFVCIMQCLTQLLSYRQHLNYDTNEIVLHCNVWCCLTVHILCCYKIILRPSQWKLCKT